MYTVKSIHQNIVDHPGAVARLLAFIEAISIESITGAA